MTEKSKIVDIILANSVYLPESEARQCLKNKLLMLSKDDLQVLDIIIRVKIADASKGEILECRI